MRRTMLSAAAVAMTLVFAAPAITYGQDQAQTQAQARQARRQQRRERLRQRFEARFQQLDANHDGVIEREEWQRNPRAFDRIDVNHDGALSQDELKAAVARAVRRRLRRRA